MSGPMVDPNHTPIAVSDIQKGTAVLPDLPSRSVVTNGVCLAFAARRTKTLLLFVQMG